MTMYSNFHEAGALPLSTRFSLLNSNTLKIKIENKKYVFRRTRLPLDQYINHNSIAGSYKDDTGNIYTFEVNGKLYINKTNVGKYKVYADSEFNLANIDSFNLIPTVFGTELLKKKNLYFKQETPWLTYSFTFSKFFDQLTLYKADSDPAGFILNPMDKSLLKLVRKRAGRVR